MTWVHLFQVRVGKMKTQKLKTFLSDETGATAIEYGLIAALVSVAAIVAMTALGTALQGIFNEVATQLNGSY